MWLSPASRGKTGGGDCRITQPRCAFRTGWKTGATLATSHVGSQGILIFKACGRYFQIALWKAWTSSTNCMRLHGFPVLLTLADSGGGLWLSTLAVVIDLPLGPACFSLWADSFPAEWLQSCPRLWSTHPSHSVFCPLDLVHIPTTSHLSGMFSDP